mmetsp:Transcript_20225/g.64540  ORF Transcript_20225/g.64540 Transcript_20225/m.64540 type:complete len:207 (-) Transcript_20225:647-1267(-)
MDTRNGLDLGPDVRDADPAAGPLQRHRQREQRACEEQRGTRHRSRPRGRDCDTCVRRRGSLEGSGRALTVSLGFSISFLAARPRARPRANRAPAPGGRARGRRRHRRAGDTLARGRGLRRSVRRRSSVGQGQRAREDSHERAAQAVKRTTRVRAQQTADDVEAVDQGGVLQSEVAAEVRQQQLRHAIHEPCVRQLVHGSLMPRALP